MNTHKVIDEEYVKQRLRLHRLYWLAVDCHNVCVQFLAIETDDIGGPHFREARDYIELQFWQLVAQIEGMEINGNLNIRLET